MIQPNTTTFCYFISTYQRQTFSRHTIITPFLHGKL